MFTGKKRVYMHNLGPKGCEGPKLPPNMKPVFEELEKMVEEIDKINAKNKQDLQFKHKKQIRTLEGFCKK